MKIAVAVFGYNRPLKLAKTLAALAQCSKFLEFDVFIKIDGPKSDSEAHLVLESSDISQGLANMHDNVHHEARGRNLGLAGNVRATIDELLKTHDAVIAVEDDLHLGKNFLVEMRSQLKLKRGDEGVFSISGHSLPSLQTEQNSWESSYFSSWGWATWKERWAEVDWQANSKMTYATWAKLDLYGVRLNRKMLRLAIGGEIDSWAIFVFLHCVKNGMLNISPGKSLVHNSGLDGTGVHRDSTKIFDITLEISASYAGKDGHLKESKKALLREMLFYLGSASPFTLAISILRFIFFLPAFVFVQSARR